MLHPPDFTLAIYAPIMSYLTYTKEGKGNTRRSDNYIQLGSGIERISLFYQYKIGEQTSLISYSYSIGLVTEVHI
jgi:hypothetical protein